MASNIKGAGRMAVRVTDGHRVYASGRVRPDIYLPLYPWPLSCISDEFSNKERTYNMGCDCTMTLEVYDKDLSRWVDTEVLELGRDYELFGLLAGVRGFELECSIPPRGLPRDACPMTVVSFNPSSDHTPSVLYGDELAKMKGQGVKKLLSKILKVMRPRAPGIPMERKRIVFWFNG